MEDNQLQQSGKSSPQDAAAATAAITQPGSASKSPAAAAASSGKRKAGSYTTSHPHDPEAAGRELLDKLAYYITQLGGTLDDGWKCNVTMVTIADNGETGTCNAAYICPSGKRYRTRAEVAKFLGLDIPSGKGARMSGHGLNSTPGSAAGLSGRGLDDASHGGTADDHEEDGSSTVSKAEAYAAAVKRAEQLNADGIQLPLRLKHNVVVEQLGSLDLRPSFNTPLSIITPGYRAVIEDPAAGKFVSEIKAPAGAKHPQFVVSLEVQQQHLQQLETAASGGIKTLPGLSDSQQQQQQQQQQQGQQQHGNSVVRIFELATARNADLAWAQVSSLLERAKMQVEAAASNAGSVGPASPTSAAAPAAAGEQGPHTDAALDPVLAQLLAKAGSNLRGCWGKWIYGLADPEVLQLIEALPNADKTPNYQFVDERGGWDKEREFLSKGRWAKRSTMQVGVRKPSPNKPQQLASKGPEAAAAAASAGKKRPHPAAAVAAAAAATAGSDSALFGPSANKRYRSMDREDRQVAGAVDKVLDKMIRKLEVWWVNETAREAKKAEKAEARQAANEARKAARAAAKEAAEKESGTPDKQHQSYQRSLPPAAVPLQEDLLLSGVSTSPAPAAAAAFRVLKGKQAEQLLQVWEFACCFGPLLGLEQVPSLQQLEAGVLGLVSHTGAMASSLLDRVDPAVDSSSKQQPPSDADEIEDVSPAVAAARSAAATALGISQQQIEAEAAAGNCWVQLHTAVLGILIEDVFTAVSSATFDTEHMKAAQLRELRTAMPQVDFTTWPEAARRYLAAAATATYLAQGEPKSSATGTNAKELDMPGHLKSMEVQDWAQYLCGGLNVPDLVSRIALLPQGSSETAAESLLMLDDAAALAAAEEVVQQLAKQQQQQQQQQQDQQQEDNHAMDVDGQEAAVATPKPDADQQQLLGRRLLQALIKVWGDKSKINSGQRMCFYAQELNPKLGRARGLDLHSVAARLEQGLYQATGDSLEALSADIVLACDLWRDAFNTFDMSREEGFRSADGRLADAVEERMQQLLQAIKDGSDLAGVAGLKQENQGFTGQAEDGGAQPDGPDAQATGPEGLDKHNQGPESQAGGGQQQPDQQQADVVRMKQEQEGIAAAAAPADAAPMDIDSPGQQPDQQRQEPEHREHQQQVQAVNLQEVKQEDAVKQEGAELGPAAAAAAGEDKAPLDDVQQQNQLEDNSPGPQEQQDPHGLKDPQRPFNPLYGCRVCWKEDDKARLLLCDGCEDEYHCYCVTPALLEVPEGDWYCPVCAKAPPAGIDDTTAAAAAASTAELAQGSSSSDNVSWDMATSAQLPAVTSSTEPIWERPGMQYIKELVGTAQRLGAVPYGSWPVDARLSLITLLCELLAASHAGRQFVEDRMEQKREAKRRIAEARAKINKAKKEAAEAAKAAAKAARQKAEGGKAEGGGSAAAGGTGDGTAAAQEESVDAAAANAPSSKAGKSSKGKKAAAAAAGKLSRAAVPADEPFDEEAELRNIAAQQQLIELTNIRRLCLGQDRFKNTYWLLGTSQLPVVEDASDNAAAAEIGTEQQQLQQSVNGPKQQHSGSMGSYGVVMVEPCKMTAAAKQQAEAAAVSLADTAASILASVLPPTAPLPPVVKGDMGPLRMLMDSDDSESSSRAAAQQVLLPALQLHDQQQQAAAAGDAGTAPVAKPWGVYRSVVDIDALLTWLNPLGVRESALRSALHKVRDNMVLFAPTVPAAAEQQQQQQQLERDVKGSRAGSPFVSLPLQPPINAAVAAGPEESKHPKLVLKFKMQRRQQEEQQQQQQQQQQQSTADDASAGGDVNAAPGQASESQQADDSIALHTQQQQHSAAVNPDLLQRVIAAAAAADDAAAAAALRSRFERLLASIPDLSLHEFWGSDSRRDAWFAALAAATRPSDFAALVATLENMVLTDSWRVGFQIWSVPAQHPGLVVTWPQVWYRFLGVEAAKRPGLPTRQQRDRAQELMWRSQAKDKTGQQQQQQHDKRQRYEAAVGEYDDGLEEDEAVGTSSRRQQQQQQQSLYGSRSGAHGSSSRLTRGRQQQGELFVPRTGRAAAAKAAAAITEQSKGVAAIAGRRSKYLEYDDDFDLEDYSSEPGSGNGSDDPGQQQQQQQDEDAALAAALATQSHYPRRAAAVAATAAMAAASGHQPQQQQRHSRLARGSAKQAGRAGAAAAAKKPSRQQQQQNAGSGKGSKSRSKQKGGSRRRVQNSDSEEEEYSELSDGDEEVPSEHDVSDDDGVQDAPNEPVSNKQHQKSATDDQKPHITIKGSKAAAEAAAAAERNEHHQQQQRKQDAQSADEGGKQHKRPASDANDVAAAAAAADFGEEAKVLQPPAKKLKVEQQAAAQTTQMQQQQQQHEQTAAQASAAAPGSDAGKTAAAAAGSGKAGATAATVAAAAKTKSGPLKVMIKKPQQPKSKTEALQDLLGLGAAPLSTLSGKRPAAAAAAGSGAAKSSSQTGTAAAAGAKGAAAAAGGADGDGAAGEGSKPGIMSPKKMLLQRHESETMQQLQQLQKVKTQTAGHGAAGGGSGTGKHGGSNTPRASATGHFSMKARLAAEQRAKADPKAAAKEKVAWSDEDDD